jgi:hypothetical protein
MTPPNDPAQKPGYFEYGENSFADLQGEDTDDFLAFTTKAREGEYFTGRQYLLGTSLGGNNFTINPRIQPVTITSQVAEVIYFLRNGNLYRRVFLVAPERQKSLTTNGLGLAGGNYQPLPKSVYQTTMFGPSLFVSWLGMNDLSARPGGFTSIGGVVAQLPPVLNDLGDLANRENRAFRPRFLNDVNPQDGVPDDNNADGVNDYYPTLYTDGTNGWNGRPNGHVNEVVPYPTAAVARQNPGSYDLYAFPFIYPGMYSVPDPVRAAQGLGWVHYPSHTAAGGLINHSPLQFGEPTQPTDFTMNFAGGGQQTWWGFPTWRETMAGRSSGGGGLGWTDPVFSIGSAGLTQVLGLRPYQPNVAPAIANNLLPPIYNTNSATPSFSFDGAGSSNFVADPAAAGSTQSVYPTRLWEDDLILTNVRSFDVKAYDPDAPLYSTAANGLFSSGYQDLGYGAASYVSGLPANNNGTPVLPLPPFQASGSPQGFGHEGRVPPLPTDFRFHPRRPALNVGDPGLGVIRLTRTFDTWSTAYTGAPDADILLNGYFPTSPPIYPSFPPPYPSPLRGIQIQIRVVDPRNEKSKVLTIRHDFTDKLTN